MSLYGLPDKKKFDGKDFWRMGIYSSENNAKKDAMRYRKDGYLTHIMEVPEKNSRWKYGLYVRKKGRK